MGKVASNLMIDTTPSNDKLKERAVKILMDLQHSTTDGGNGSPHNSDLEGRVRSALAASDWRMLDARQLLLEKDRPRL